METDYLPYLSKPMPVEETSNGVTVEVIAKFDKIGKPTPLYILWSDGRKFKVNSVLDMKPRVRDGIYYTVQIGSYIRKIHFVDNKWIII